MRRTLLAFFGLVFVIYWLATADLPEDQPAFRPIKALVQSSALRAVRTHTFTRTPAAAGAEDEVRAWFRQEAARVGAPDAQPARTEKRLREHVQRFKKTELEFLAATARDPSGDGDPRFLAIYLLGLSDSPDALDLLQKIGEEPLPPPRNDRAYSDEVVVRAFALEAVVKRLPQAESIRFLRALLDRTPDPAVARHAQYWLSHLG